MHIKKEKSFSFGAEEGSRFKDGCMERRAALLRLSGGSGCDNDTVIVSRLHRRIAKARASTAAAFSRQPSTYLVIMSTLDCDASHNGSVFNLKPSCDNEASADCCLFLTFDVMSNQGWCISLVKGCTHPNCCLNESC